VKEKISDMKDQGAGNGGIVMFRRRFDREEDLELTRGRQNLDANPKWVAARVESALREQPRHQER
jgi:hypothetical protein